MQEIQPELPGTETAETDKLSQIMILANKMEDLHLQQNRLMKELEDLSEEGKRIQEVLLPDLMMSAGLTDLTLQSGRRISVKTDYYPAISKQNWDAAKAWLEANKMSSIIKSQCVVDAREKERLEKAGVTFELEEKIHPQTLKALVREQLTGENKDSFPRNLFSVFEKQMAMIKET